MTEGARERPEGPQGRLPVRSDAIFDRNERGNRTPDGVRNHYAAARSFCSFFSAMLRLSRLK